MNITITKELFSAVGQKKLEPWIKEEDVRWGEASVNLFGLTKKSIEALRAVLDGVAAPGALRCVRDIDVWLSAAEEGGVAGVKVKTLKQFAGIAYGVLQDQPKHWIYKLDQASKVWSAFYVSRIEHHPAETTRSGGYVPEHVNIIFVQKVLGKLESIVVKFQRSDLGGGGTVLHLLSSKGYVPESKKLAALYAEHEAHFLKHHAAVGRQFLARGFGELSDEYWSRPQNMEVDGVPTRCVIDVLSEDGRRNGNREDHDVDHNYWRGKSTLKTGTDPKNIQPGDEDEDETYREVVPESFTVPVFDMRRHARVDIHCSNLTEYVYNEKLADKLVVPSRVRNLVAMLIQHRGTFNDIVSGKGGGVAILTAGPPGVGKTLTAEVYAEADKRPLYSVQCSQLGTNEEALEKTLKLVFSRAKRWNAILLLDEADVYVMRRGSDLQQNAIVGVFLRVMEYYDGVMFLTTNRADTVDDAIASRCIARINYQLPTEEEQVRIWRVLAEVSGLKLAEGAAEQASKLWKLSGRDVKQLLKLASLVLASKGRKTVTLKTLKFVKRFKPTNTEGVTQ